jgi:phenylacetate-CoA ligase
VNPLLLKAYHRLPPAGRSLAVSIHGRRLNAWRYGPETERLVEEALEREHWSSEKWQAWIDDRLARLLHRAATKVPYYREQWATRRQKGDRSSWDRLSNWPLLSKSIVRRSPDAFIADDCDRRKMYAEATSGTTGTPLKIWWSRETTRAWYGLFEARARRWHGVNGGDRWAMLGGQVVIPIRQTRPPFWVWNEPMRQLYLSSFHLSPDSARSYLEAMEQYQVKYLLGYPSSLHVLARASRQCVEAVPDCRVVLANAEPLHDTQRAAIADAFRCPVRETYGMAELVSSASECEHGNLHLWPEVGVMEIREPDQEAGNESGDFVCTGLLNTDMPLIRYVVGDSGSLPRWGSQCHCGRSLPQVDRIHGRSNDMLLTRDGRRVFWLNPVFYGLPVEEAQIIQDRLDQIRVRYTASPDFSDRALRTMRDRLHERLGPIQVLTEPVSCIPREANGKFRAVVCNVPEHERAF